MLSSTSSEHTKKKGTQLIDLSWFAGWNADLPGRPGIFPAGTCFQVVNRSVARLTHCEKQGDYELFERVLELAHERVELPIFFLHRDAQSLACCCSTEDGHPSH
jgi:hypothetical protein